MTDSRYYDAYWKPVSGSPWTPDSSTISPDERHLFQKHLPKGASCLDYGCGSGKRYGLFLAKEDVDYHGFDISKTALVAAGEAGLNVQPLTNDGKTNLSGDSMDVAICFEVLEHLMEPGQVVDELRRCLKPQGVVLASVPNAGGYLQRLEFLLTGFWCPGGSPHTARKEPWRDPHIRFFNPAMLRRLFVAHGWEVIELRGERFSLCSLPVIWRKERLHPLLARLSAPLGWLGRVFPGLFSKRLFIVARKPLAQHEPSE